VGFLGGVGGWGRLGIELRSIEVGDLLSPVPRCEGPVAPVAYLLLGGEPVD